MTPLERMARSLFKMFRGVEPGGLAWKDYIDDARALLSVMREPSDSMLDATTGRFTVEEHFIEADLIVGAEALWRAMIDAALAEGPQS